MDAVEDQVMATPGAGLPLPQAEAEAAFASRDRAYDGRFVVAVTSTGIYCRPTCPARRPRPEHTRFLADAAAAQAQGYRPCKRCLPDDVAPDAAAVARVLALLSEAGGPVPLARLGDATGYSQGHLQRIFKRATGLSPAAYGRSLRRGEVQDLLTRGGKVTDAIYAAGYGASSRFYADTRERMGMAPSAWANGGFGVTIRWAVVETDLGGMLVAATEKGVCRLSFGEGRDDLAALFPRAELIEGGEAFAALLTMVVAAVETPATGADIPLDVKGTAFQERVWAQLRAIPAGETRSYGAIAAALGQPGAMRAVGSANGANRVAVLIPCHRVVRSDGSTGGYAYGEAIKRELLRRERCEDQTKL